MKQCKVSAPILELKPHQTDAVEKVMAHFVSADAALLALEMGLGKTITSLEILYRLVEGQRSFTALVIAPASLLDNWGAEISKYCKIPVQVSMYRGANRWFTPRKAGGHIVLTTIETLLADTKDMWSHVLQVGFANRTIPWFVSEKLQRARQFDAVIVDEAHEMRNPDSSAYSLLYAIRQKARKLLLLSGSPINTGPQDLGSLMALMTAVPEPLWTHARRCKEETAVEGDGFEQAGTWARHKETGATDDAWKAQITDVRRQLDATNGPAEAWLHDQEFILEHLCGQFAAWQSMSTEDTLEKDIRAQVTLFQQYHTVRGGFQWVGHRDDVSSDDEDEASVKLELKQLVRRICKDHDFHQLLCKVLQRRKEDNLIALYALDDCANVMTEQRARVYKWTRVLSVIANCTGDTETSGMLDREFEHLRSKFIVHRRIADVALDMPQNTVEDVGVVLSSLERDIYVMYLTCLDGSLEFMRVKGTTYRALRPEGTRTCDDQRVVSLIKGHKLDRRARDEEEKMNLHFSDDDSDDDSVATEDVAAESLGSRDSSVGDEAEEDDEDEDYDGKEDSDEDPIEVSGICVEAQTRAEALSEFRTGQSTFLGLFSGAQRNLSHYTLVPAFKGNARPAARTRGGSKEPRLGVPKWAESSKFRWIAEKLQANDVERQGRPSRREIQIRDCLIRCAEGYTNGSWKAAACERLRTEVGQDVAAVVKRRWEALLGDYAEWPQRELSRRGFARVCAELLIQDEEIKDVMSAPIKMLVFSNWTDPLSLLAEYLQEQVQSDRVFQFGEQRKRQQVLHDFTTSKLNSVMLGTFGTMGHGLNITCAEQVVFLDACWNPQMELQAKHRVYRIGQTKPTTCFRLHAVVEHNGKIFQTIEQRVLKLQGKRLDVEQTLLLQHRAHQLDQNQLDKEAAADKMSATQELVKDLKQMAPFRVSPPSGTHDLQAYVCGLQLLHAACNGSHKVAKAMLQQSPDCCWMPVQDGRKLLDVFLPWMNEDQALALFTAMLSDNERPADIPEEFLVRASAVL